MAKRSTGQTPIYQTLHTHKLSRSPVETGVESGPVSGTYIDIQSTKTA